MRRSLRPWTRRAALSAHAAQLETALRGQHALATAAVSAAPPTTPPTILPPTLPPTQLPTPLPTLPPTLLSARAACVHACVGLCVGVRVSVCVRVRVPERCGLAAMQEAARAEALSQHDALSAEVSGLRTERSRLVAQLDHYIGRADALVEERGAGQQQLSELSAELVSERARFGTEEAAMRQAMAALKEEKVAAYDEAARLRKQNEALHADLREVTTLIDQLVSMRPTLPPLLPPLLPPPSHTRACTHVITACAHSRPHTLLR